MDVKLGFSYRGKEHKLRIFVKRVIRRIFAPVMEEVAGGYEKLHDE
jgi:hypothetical protein